MSRYANLVSSKAKADMLEIYKYISENLGSYLSALKMFKNIEDSIRSLDEMPERFRRYKDQELDKENIRVCPVKK